MVRWESEYLDTGRFNRSKGHPCTTAPVLDGPNVKSESLWSYCLYEFLGLSSSNYDPSDKMILSASNPEKSQGYIKHTLYDGGHLLHSIYGVYIPLQRCRLVIVGLSGNANTFVRNLWRNFDLLRNVIVLTLTFLSDLSVDASRFQVNGSQVKVLADLVYQSNLANTGYWVSGIVRGMLTFRTNVHGSQL